MKVIYTKKKYIIKLNLRMKDLREENQIFTKYFLNTITIIFKMKNFI